MGICYENHFSTCAHSGMRDRSSPRELKFYFHFGNTITASLKSFFKVEYAITYRCPSQFSALQQKVASFINLSCRITAILNIIF